MKRKILSIILTLVLILSLLPATALAAYTDVQNHWAQTAIDKWSNLGIITGWDGKFRPEDPITRGEVAVIVDRLMKFQTTAENTFTDLGQEFYTDAILKANAAGIITGYDAKVRPTANITREEAIVMLGRAFGLKESVTASEFTDSASISSWALGYVNAMADRGFIHGSQGAFNPKSPITRASIITILDNAISGLYTEAKEYTGDVSGIAIINTPNVILKDMTITGDLIIAEGVGSGDVTLSNVNVTGNTIVRGGGSNSIHIQGTSQLKNLIIEKTDAGQIRIVTEGGAVVDAVFVDDGTDDIILTGAFESVTVAADVSVKAVNTKIDTVNIAGENATFDLDKDSSVGTLTANVATTITNSGTITKAEVNADNVTIGGNAPTTVTYATGVQGIKDTDTSGGNPGGGGTPATPSVGITSLTVVNATTVTFSSNAAGATIKWNGVTLSAQTSSNAVNTITVPLMVSGAKNSLIIERTGYIAYTNSDVVWNDPLTFKTSPLGNWENDRTEPNTWTETAGWITYSTKTEPANNWYAWHGKKTATNNAVTDNWKVETEFELTDALLARDGVRTSMWLNVQDEYGADLDWAILQFKIDETTQTKGWQYWVDTPGSWVDINANLPTTAGIYKLAIYYTDGEVVGYINGIEVFSYAKGAHDISSVKEVILNSYSFGDSYDVKWKVPTVSYVDLYPVGAKFISTAAQLSAAIANQADGQTWVIQDGTYNIPRTNIVGTTGADANKGTYLNISANDLIIIGENATITTTEKGTGNWQDQQLVVVKGNNVTIKGINFIGNISEYSSGTGLVSVVNKIIEIFGDHFTLKDSTVTARPGYDGGTIYYSCGEDKTSVLDGVKLEKGRISFSGATGLNLTLRNVEINYTGSSSEVDGYLPIYKLTNTSTVAAENVVARVGINSTAYLKQTLENLPSGATLQLAAGTYYVTEELSKPGVALDTSTNGAAIVVMSADSVFVSNVSEFATALSDDAIATIYMAAGTYEFDSQIRINKAINIIGAGDSTIITKGAAPWTNATGSKGHAPLITINSGDNAVKLEGIKVTGAANIAMTPSGTDYGSGINVVGSSNVILNNVTSTYNAAAGLIVNGSTVIATNLKTAGNAWGAVNVDPGSGITTPSVFTLSGISSLSEPKQIWSDGVNVTDEATVAVSTPGTDGYVQYTSTDSVESYIWNNKPIGFTISTTVYATLQAAIAAAEDSGDTILVAPGVYPIASPITIEKGLTIEGLGTAGGVTFAFPDHASGFIVNSGTENVTMKNLVLAGVYSNPQLYSSSSTGIHITSTTTGSFTLTDSQVNGFWYGLVSDWATPTNNTDHTMQNSMSITGSSFTGNAHKAIYVERANTVAISGSTFVENAQYDASSSSWYTKVAVDINLKYGEYASVSVTGCTFTDNGSPLSDPPHAGAFTVALGIKARDDAPSYNTIFATLASMTVSGNTFQGNVHDVQFGEPGKGNLAPSTILFNGNSFMGTNGGGFAMANDLADLILDVSSNNWGSTPDFATLVKGSVTTTH